MMSYAAASFFALLMAGAAAGDVFTLRIPNWLTILIAALFVPAALIAGMPWTIMGLSLLVGLVLLLAGFCLFAAGIFGGGDAKLMAAAALWMGWPAVLPFLFWTGLSGSVLALLILAINLVRRKGQEQAGQWQKQVVPYGVALAAGAMLALPQSWWLSAQP